MHKMNVHINGVISFDLGWRGLWQKIIVVGGPFDLSYQSKGTYNLCLKAEGTDAPYDALLPIRDFKVPTDDDEVLVAIMDAITAARNGKLIWVGCMGGQGRTGLFLALLAKACGADDPVKDVRARYYGHAVETEEQKRYVDNFDINPIRSFILRDTWKRLTKR